MGLREGSGILWIASMHRFRVTRGAKWALSRGRRDSLHSVARRRRRRRRRRRAEGTSGGAVGGSDKTGDMGAGGRHLHCELLQYEGRVETSPQSGSCLKQCCTSSKALRAAKIASFSLQPTDPSTGTGVDCHHHHHNQS